MKVRIETICSSLRLLKEAGNLDFIFSSRKSMDKPRNLDSELISNKLATASESNTGRQKNKGRYTPENQQEDLGIAQFAVLMARKGWPFTLIGRDTGEDLMARIFDGGNATGIDFLVQHKSTSHWDSLLLADETLSYSLEVADLQHWRKLWWPVVLVVWDVEKSAGRWLLLQKSLAVLDKRNPNWATQTTATLHLPASNTLDEEGLVRLRWELAEYVLPLVSKDTLTFTVDTTKIALPQDICEALDRFVRFGEAVELRGNEIRAVEFPETWTRLFGPSPHSAESLLILASFPSTSGVAFRLDLLASNGRRSSVPLVELRRTKGGTEQLVLSNAHESSTLLFTLISTRFSQPDSNGKTGNINFSINLRESLTNAAGEVVEYPATTSEAQDAMEFLDVLADGGILKLTLLGEEQMGQPKESIRIPIAPNAQVPPAEERQKVSDFYKTLQEAETRFGVSFTLPGFRFTDKDLESAKELEAIFLSGRYVENRDRYFSLTAEGCRLLVKNFRGGQWKDGDPISIRVTSEDATIVLLDVTLLLGNYSEDVVGPLEWTLNEIEERASKLKGNESINICLVNAKLVHTFPQWIPENPAN